MAKCISEQELPSGGVGFLAEPVPSKRESGGPVRTGGGEALSLAVELTGSCLLFAEDHH